MREFFHGWRRKAGCVTLVMALLAWCGWVRSYACWDEISFISPFWTGINTVHTSRYGFGWYRMEGDGIGYINGWLQGSTEGPESDPFFPVVSEPEWKRQLLFVEFGRWKWRSLPGVSARFIRISHWVTIPLTLLSAYLILWKPRPARLYPSLTKERT